MNIGDRVRTKHGNDEGIIVKLIDQKIVEIEIEDGFTIPVAKSDLVRVATQEKDVFEKPTSSSTPVKKELPKKTVLSTQGFFLAITQEGEHLLKISVVNNTDLQGFFTFGTSRHGNFKHEKADKLNPKSSVLLIELKLTQQDKWPSIQLDIIRYHEDMEERLLPLISSFPPKPSRLLTGLKEIPVLKTQGHLHQLDESKAPKELENIADMMMEPKAEDLAQPAKQKGLPMEPEVDLHLEELVDEPGSVPEKERLALQLRTFQNTLDNAIAQGCKGITFIHGVGAGILRQEIHKLLAKNPHIQYFEDAAKEKFGYGATYVKI